MKPPSIRHQGSRCDQRRTGNKERRTRGGFTLIEIVIVLTILSVLAAATVPTFKGLAAERRAREPVTELLRMAKEARQRAMKEHRPYQIAITAQGFTASRYFDGNLSFAELETFLTAIDSAEQEGLPEEADIEGEPSLRQPDPASAGMVAQSKPGSTGQPLTPKPEWNERFSLPEGTRVSVWLLRTVISADATDNGKVPVEGERVMQWVFQPNGMCEPMSIKLENESAYLYARFDALTADLVKETVNLK